MTTELAKQDPNHAMIEFGSMMDAEKASARDILIPKILFMQPVSKFVAKEKAKPGELRASLDATCLAERGKTTEFIAFNRFKTRVTFKKVKGKQEYQSTTPWVPAYEGVPRNEIIGGEEYEHFETLNYYVLLTSDIASGEAFPYLISFRSTAYKTGKALETFRTKLQMANKPLPFKTFQLGLEQTENDKGTFYVPTVTMGRNSTDEELSQVKNWFDLVTPGSVKHDDSDLEEKDPTDQVDTVNMNTNF